VLTNYPTVELMDRKLVKDSTNHGPRTTVERLAISAVSRTIEFTREHSKSGSVCKILIFVVIHWYY